MGAISFSLDPALLQELLRLLPLSHFVETGTYNGNTVEMARHLFNECLSVELSKEYYSKAAIRFEGIPNVTIYNQSSPVFLRANRKKLQTHPTLFWLDAHWCVEGSAGEKSQCPLIDELKALEKIHAESVILIDDARLLLAPPPAPYEFSNWPDLEAILRSLHKLSHNHSLICLNDVFIYAPSSILPQIKFFAHENTVDLLTLADKSRGYDKQLEQSKSKDVEIHAKEAALLGMQAVAAERGSLLEQQASTLHQQRLELEQAKSIAAERERELLDKEHEITSKHAALVDLQKCLEHLQSELNAKEAALQRMQAVAAERGSLLEQQASALHQQRLELEQAAFIADQARADAITTTEERGASLASVKAFLETEIASLRQARITDSEQLAVKDAAILEKESSIAEKQAEIERLSDATARFQELLAASTHEADLLREVAENRLKEMETIKETLEKECARKDEEIGLLSTVCREREQLLQLAESRTASLDRPRQTNT